MPLCFVTINRLSETQRFQKLIHQNTQINTNKIDKILLAICEEPT